MYRKKFISVIIALLVVFQITVPSSFALAWDLSKYVVKDSNNFYEYDAISVTLDYLDFLGGDSEGKLASDMIKAGNTLVAYYETAKARYISANELSTAYLDFLGGDRPSFDLQDFIVNEAGTYAIPEDASFYYVSLNTAGNVERTLRVNAPTASAFSIGGDAGVTTVDGTVVGNEITFAVDPNDTYTTASVTLSQDVHVTVTKAGETTPAGTDVFVEAGTLSVVGDLLEAFNISKTSATGAELIAQTPADSAITVLLKSAADPTKTTTYTVKFVAQ